MAAAALCPMTSCANSPGFRSSLAKNDNPMVPMDLPDAIDAIRPSIVQVAYMEHLIPEAQQLARGLQSPGYNKPFGTGFFVNNEGFVVTAKHVVDEASRRFNQGPEAEGKHAVVVGLAWPNIDANFRAWSAPVSGDTSSLDFLPS